MRVPDELKRRINEVERKVTQREYRHALVLVEDVIADFPDEAEPFYVKASIFDITKRTEAAIDTIGEAIQRNPTELYYYHMRALYCLRVGMARQAVSDLTHVIDAEQASGGTLFSPEATHFLALALEQDDKLEEALELLDSLPDDARTWVRSLEVVSNARERIKNRLKH